MAGIFISYRHEDTAYAAGRLFHDLNQVFGGDRKVFRDVDIIRAGSDWAASIKDALNQCDVVLAVIGPHWLEELQQRLDRRERDWVRYELACALKRRELRVIPILLDDARMPRPEELPGDLERLPGGQKSRLSDESYSYDFDRLVQDIGGASGTVNVQHGPMARKAPYEIVLTNARFALVLDGTPCGDLDVVDGTRLQVSAGDPHSLEVRAGFEHGPILPSTPRVFQLKGGESIGFLIDIETSPHGKSRCVISDSAPAIHRPPSGRRGTAR